MGYPLFPDSGIFWLSAAALAAHAVLLELFFSLNDSICPRACIWPAPNRQVQATVSELATALEQPVMAQLLGQHAGAMLQREGGKLTPMEAARLAFKDEWDSASAELRRRLFGRAPSPADSEIDRLRLFALGAGSGVKGLEALLVLASFAGDDLNGTNCGERAREQRVFFFFPILCAHGTRADVNVVTLGHRYFIVMSVLTQTCNHHRHP